MFDSGLIRVPGSRPYKPSPSKDQKAREESWDNRFHLGKMPEYTKSQDKFFQPRFPVQKKKIILGVGRIRKVKNPSQKQLKKQSNSKPSLLKTQIIKRLKENLSSQWEAKKIPEPQRLILLESIESLPAKKQSSILVKEIELFKQDRNFTQLVLRAIRSRENSLIELRDFADVITNPTSTIKHNSVESLINLRMLGLHVVECIQAWRKNLHEYEPGLIPDNLVFWWEGQNYLVKMLTDYEFLLRTQIANFIEVQLNDPFFGNNNRKVGKIELPMPGYLLKRIKESEKVLQAEGPIRISEIVEKKSPVLTVSRSQVLEDVLDGEIELVSVTEYEKNINEYSKDVPQVIQESTGKCCSALANSLSLRYPSFLFAKIKNLTIGLVTLNLDSQKSVHNRLLISHISALSIELFQKLASFIINYIWETYPCIEIRVGLIARINQQGKYECEQAVKSVFDKLGFRWKQMIYSINETPVQMLGIRRAEPFVPKQLSIFSDSLILSYACGVQKAESPPDNINNFCSAIGIACAYRPYISTPFSMFTEILNKTKAIPPAFKHRKDNSLEAASRDLPGIQLKFSSLNEMRETSVSCSSLGLSWERFLPVVYMKRKYTKVIGQINIMKGKQLIIYILPTEDPVYNVFIIPNQGGLPATFKDTRMALISMQKVSDTQEIWIPDFEVKGKHFANHLEETFVFRLSTQLHPLGSYSEGVKESDTVISSQFIFGLIHQKIDEDLEVPLFVFEVQVKDFIN